MTVTDQARVRKWLQDNGVTDKFARIVQEQPKHFDTYLGYVLTEAKKEEEAALYAADAEPQQYTQVEFLKLLKEIV